MKSLLFEILEHKADLKIKVFGRTKKELFENAMIGMFEAAKYKPTTDNIQRRTRIKISSFDLSSLLIDFLTEILYLAETKKEIYHKVNFKKFSKNKIEAELIGKKLEEVGVHIKAVTYYDLKIRQQKDKTWWAIILFDV